MNILITGDAGFVGRHLSKALSDRGDSVFGFDIKTGLSLDAFLTDFHALCKYDVAIHLAANIVNVDAREKMGVLAFEDLALDYKFCCWAQKMHMHNSKMRVVLLSSCAVDGLTDPYSAIKRTLESEAAALRRIGLHVTVLRPYSGYGGDQSEEYPFPAIMCRALNHEDPLMVWGGDQVRDWLYIDDLVSAVIHAIDGKFPTDRPIDIGTGMGVDFYRLAQDIADAVGYDPVVKGDSTKAISSDFRVASTGLAKLHGWSSRTSLKDGIRSALEVMRALHR